MVIMLGTSKSIRKSTGITTVQRNRSLNWRILIKLSPLLVKDERKSSSSRKKSMRRQISELKRLLDEKEDRADEDAKLRKKK